MKRSDVADLVTYMTQLQPAQKVDEYTDVAWFDVLGDVDATLDQARRACAEVAKRERWIFPSAIREELKAIRARENPTPPAPAITQGPHKYEPYAERSERIARGLSKVEPILAQIRARKAAEDGPEAGVSETLQRARDIAREMKRERDRAKAPRPLADALDGDPRAVVAQFKTIPERTDQP